MSDRITPEAALRPGTRDPAALLTLWYVRKSFYWLLGIGFVIAAVVGRVEEVGVDLGSPNAVWSELLSPLVLVILAFIVRLGTSLAGLVLAYPLAKAYEVRLEPRTNFGKSIGAALDRLKVMRAYRSLRWTHHVRQLALRRLGGAGARLSHLDRILDVANISFLVLGVIVLGVTGSSTD